MAGVGVSTVCTIVCEVSESIIDNLWKDSVMAHFPSDELVSAAGIFWRLQVAG